MIRALACLAIGVAVIAVAAVVLDVDGADVLGLLRLFTGQVEGAR